MRIFLCYCTNLNCKNSNGYLEKGRVLFHSQRLKQVLMVLITLKSTPSIYSIDAIGHCLQTSQFCQSKFFRSRFDIKVFHDQIYHIVCHSIYHFRWLNCQIPKYTLEKIRRTLSLTLIWNSPVAIQKIRNRVTGDFFVGIFIGFFWDLTSVEQKFRCNNQCH